MFDIVNVEAPDHADLIFLGPEGHPKSVSGVYDRVQDTMYLPLPDRISTLVIGLSNYMQCDLCIIFSSKQPIDIDQFKQNGIPMSSVVDEFGIVALVSYSSLLNFFHNVRENDLVCNALLRLEQQIELKNSEQIAILNKIPLEDKTNA